MRASIIITAGAVLAAMSLPLAAQTHPTRPEFQEVKIINNHSDGDSLEQVNVYNIFVENAPKAFNVPGAPRFAIEGKDHKFYLGIGGQAKATLSFDWGNPIDNAFDFTTSAIPMHLAPGNGGKTQFSAATSGLFVNFVALPGDKNQLGVYLNANLTGGDYAFDLQYAYIKFRGITAGYDYSLFSDMAAAPPSIDNEGPNGFTAIPKGVVDYRYDINSRWSVAVGVEQAIASYTTGTQTESVSQRVPDIPLYAQYSWGDGSSWLRFSGIIRNMQYRDLVTAKNRNVVGWGVKFSGSAKLGPVITAYYQGAYGRGLTSYFQDCYEGGLDLTPDASAPGKLEAVKSWGGYIGLQYTISPKVYATTTYSHVRTYMDRYSGGETEWADQYKYTQYALANVIWQITPMVSTGMEYIWGRRVNQDGLSRHDNRIQTMLQVTF